MKLKNENGITGIDIIISIILITIFIAIITTLAYQTKKSSEDLKRRTGAFSYAVQTIEQIKRDGYESLPKVEDADYTNKIERMTGYIPDTSYYQEVLVYDYTELKPENVDKKSDVLKKVTVKVSYLSGGQEQVIELSILLTKEN